MRLDWSKVCDWCKGYMTTLNACACPPVRSEPIGPGLFPPPKFDPVKIPPETIEELQKNRLVTTGLNSVVTGKPTSPERPSNRPSPGSYDDRAPPADPVNHPPHYQGKVETIDAIESALGLEGFRAYCRGNAIKYLSRLGKKGPAAEDAQKAQWYVDKLAGSYL